MKKQLLTTAIAMGIGTFTYSTAGAEDVNGVFKDVMEYKEEIEFLTNLEIINGYDDDTFRPTQSTKRIHAVQMILREKGVTDFSAPDPGFKDMTPESYGYAEVAKAVDLGIVSGRTNDNGDLVFDPADSLTRSQMAKILTEAYDLQNEWNYYFTDVDRDHWAKEYVDSLASQAITTGYEDRTFKPQDPIQRQHFAVFMARILNEDFITGSYLDNISYMPDTENRYTYSDDYYGDFTMSYEGLDGIWDYWKAETDEGRNTEWLFAEDKEGFFIGYPQSEYMQYLKYPVKEGQQIDQGFGIHAQVIDTNATIETKAGTFEHVIITKSDAPNEPTYYFAPNHGWILMEFGNGETTERVELISID